MKPDRRHIHTALSALILALCAFALAGCGMHQHPDRNLDLASAADASEKQLAECSSSSLLAAADSLYRIPESKDRACLIYKIIASRYKENPDDAEASMRANLKLWDRYTFDFHDVSVAIEYLNAAADICETYGLRTAEVDYGYAISYQSMGNHTKEPELYHKSLDFYEEAFAKITQTGETGLYDRMIPNYLTLLYSINEPMQRGDTHLEAYVNAPLVKSSEKVRYYNLELHKGFSDLQARRFTNAAAHFRNMRSHIPPDERKQMYMSLLNEATALQQAGMVREALSH